MQLNRAGAEIWAVSVPELVWTSEDLAAWTALRDIVGTVVNIGLVPDDFELVASLCTAKTRLRQGVAAATAPSRNPSRNLPRSLARAA